MTQPQTKLRWWFACCLPISTFSCPPVPAAEPAPANPQPLNEKELFSYKPKGRGTATGQVFLSSSSGKAITQAGVPVHLIPRVQYPRYWFDGNVRVNRKTPCSLSPHNPDESNWSLLVHETSRRTLLYSQPSRWRFRSTPGCTSGWNRLDGP